MEACRVCLAVDRKMFVMDTEHKQLYENVTGIIFPPIDQLPNCICWECRHFVAKFFNFKNKAVISHFILMQILKTQNITLNTLKKYQPKPPLLCTETLLMNLDGKCQNEVDHVEVENMTELDNVEYKMECKMEYNMENENVADYIWETEANNISYDNGEIYVKNEVNDKTIDYPTVVADLETYKRRQSISNMDTEDYIRDMNDENTNAIIIVEDNDNNICNKKTNNIDTSQESVNSENINNNMEITKETISKVQIVDNHSEDTDNEEEPESLVPKNDANVNKHATNASSESVVRTKRAKQKRIKLDETMFTITILSKEEQIAEMNKKQENVHYVKSPLKCTDCFKGFQDIDAFNRHIALHSQSNGAFECSICKLRYRRRYILTSHMQKHSLRIICKECDYSTYTYLMAYNHQMLHKGKRYNCPHCDAEFVHVSSYLSHLRTNHPSDIICQQCGCSFINEMGLRMHKKKVHRFDLKPVPEDGPYCEQCDLRFVSQEAFGNHEIWSSKHTDQSYQRNVITRRKLRVPGVPGTRTEFARTARTRMLKTQWMNRRDTPPPATGPYPCEQCDMMLPDPRSYFSHFRQEHKGHNRTVFFTRGYYMCEICGQICQDKYQFREHQRRHPESLLHVNGCVEKPGPFPCGVCGKVFSNKANRSRHMNTHKGNIYECEICHKEFNDSGNRKNHVDFVHKKKARPKRNRPSRRRPKKQPEVELHTSSEPDADMREDSSEE